MNDLKNSCPEGLEERLLEEMETIQNELEEKPCFTARGCGVRGKCHTGGPFVYSWEWRRTGLFRHERGGLRKREKAGCLCGDRGGHENS